jgi:serine/threonine-protein kinase
VGGLGGTPEYMSPEQAVGAAVDPRSDVYACGALLFHAVTGQQPFTGKHPLEVIMQVADNRPAPAPSTYFPNIPPQLERIIVKALSKAPEERHQSATDLAAELNAFLRGDAPAVAAFRPVTMGAAPPARPSARPGSDAGLRGVPAAVAISSPARTSDRPPPDTLRSRLNAQQGPPSDEAPTPRVVVPAPSSPGEPAPQSIKVGGDPAQADVDPMAVTTALDSVHIREEPAATRRGLDRQVLAKQRKTVPAWAIVVGLVVLAGLAWLVRHLRFG